MKLRGADKLVSVQPFIALAQTMQEYGHRVRLATHAVYRDFVEEHGLEFYPLGGNPQVQLTGRTSLQADVMAA